MNRVCGSLLPFQQTLKTAPPPTDDDPTATAKSISAFLGRSETAIDKSLADLDAAGPSPVAGGDAAIAKLKSALTTIRRSFDRTKTAIDKIDPTKADDVASTLPTVFAIAGGTRAQPQAISRRRRDRAAALRRRMQKKAGKKLGAKSSTKAQKSAAASALAQAKRPTGRKATKKK